MFSSFVCSLAFAGFRVDDANVCRTEAALGGTGTFSRGLDVRPENYRKICNNVDIKQTRNI
jgi:hypothetical protein